ncbi:MAG TPA: pitrilysin family protein [Acidobacteriota bacterium]|nr:pitrilysin family protein [Acidobacteriota bacterium]
MRFRNSALGLALILVLLAGAAPATVQQDMERKVTEFRLPNGIQFLVMERHEAPVVSFVTYVDVGASNENVGATGLAHFFEHLAFKGTPEIGTKNYAAEKKVLDEMETVFRQILAEKRKVTGPDTQRLAELNARMDALQKQADQYVVNNEFVTILEKDGGVGTNAGTGMDATMYFINLPSNKVELWAWLESERLLRPVPREFYKEKLVIMEERRQRTESNPIGRLIEEVQTTAFKAHPYKEPTVGHMSDLAAASATEAMAFHKKYYVGRNMTVAVVGDVYPTEIKALAEKYFGPIPEGEMSGRAVTEEPKQMAEKRISMHDPSQPVVVLCYHKPDIRHPDSAVYDAIQDILAGGNSSRLHKKMVKEEKSALFVGAFPGFPGTKYPNLFLFFGVPNQNHTNEELEKGIIAELERLKNEPVSAEELAAVQTKATVNLYRQLMSNGGVALQLAYYQVMTGDWRNLFTAIDKIQKVTPADIQRVAQECFVTNNLTVGTIVHAPVQN